jgi:hypothetical protein
MPDRPEPTITDVEIVFDEGGNSAGSVMYLKILGNRLPPQVDPASDPKNVRVRRRNNAGMNERLWMGWIIARDSNRKKAVAKVERRRDDDFDFLSTDEIDVTVYNNPGASNEEESNAQGLPAPPP